MLSPRFRRCWRLANHYANRAIGFLMYLWDLEAGKDLPSIREKFERRGAELNAIIQRLVEEGCIDWEGAEAGWKAVEAILRDGRAGRRVRRETLAQLAEPVRRFADRAGGEPPSPLTGDYVGVLLAFAKFLREERE